MTVARPEYLWLLTAVPLAGIFFAIGAMRRRRLAAASPHFTRPGARGLKAFCFLSGLTLCALAAAGPGFGDKRVTTPAPPPLRLVIALDLSRSMRARDLPPDRLDAAKNLILEVLAKLPRLEVGLVGFAGRAWTACPVTADRAALALFLDAASPKDAPLGGTSPKTALEAAGLALAGYPNGAVLLVTDGEATTPASEAFPLKDIPLYTVAVGGATPVAVPDGSGGFVRDPSGKPVLAGVDAAGLAALARRTGGEAFRLAPDTENPAAAVAVALAGRMPQRQTPSVVTRPTDRTGFFLAAGLALLLADLVLAPCVPPGTLLLALVLAAPAPALAGTTAAGQNVDAGLAAWGQGDAQAALARFLAARARDPDNPAILFDIGTAYYRLGKFENALTAFDRAAADQALRAKALYNQGNAAVRLGREKEAIRCYEAALAIDPNDADAAANLAWLRSRKSTPPPKDEAGTTGDNSRRPGPSPTGNGNDRSPGEGKAPSPQAANDGSGGPRNDQAAEPVPSPDDKAGPPDAPQTPVPAREGQKSGERQAASPGKADDPILGRIPDLPGLPVSPQYGRPDVEKDW